MKDKFEKSQKNEAITVHGEKKTFETYKKNNKGHKYVFVKLSEYKKLVGSTHKKMRGGADLEGKLVTIGNIDAQSLGDKTFIVKMFKDTGKYEVVPIPSGFGDNDKKSFISKYLEQNKEGDVYLLDTLNKLCDFISTNATASGATYNPQPAKAAVAPVAATTGTAEPEPSQLGSQQV